MRGILQEPLESGAVRCNVCAFRCELSEGQVGRCRVRRNDGGEINYLAYDAMGAVCPFVGQCGAGTYCVGKPSCNWSCSFCLNSSETIPEFFDAFGGAGETPLTDDGYLDKKSLLGAKLPMFPLETMKKKDPKQVVEDWKASGLGWFAIRLTEASIHVESTSEMFKLVRAAGGNVLIATNGYWTSELLQVMAPLVDVVDVGLKGSANRKFMSKVAGVPKIEPIFETIEGLVSHGCAVMVSDLPLYHRDWESDFSRVCAFIADTIPERDYPRLSIAPFGGHTPAVAFGHFKLGIPVEIRPQVFYDSRANLMLRAVEIALEHLDMVWMQGFGALPKEEIQPLFEALPEPKVIEGAAIRVGRTQLGTVIELEQAAMDLPRMRERVDAAWGEGASSRGVIGEILRTEEQVV
ncbi:MAG: hypothetical protein GEU71_04640 [Actinobacteria bacterium]|nr:hypothetical protein [Actinomycetota bacterium]